MKNVKFEFVVKIDGFEVTQIFAIILFFYLIKMYPRWDLNPHGHFCPPDFKSGLYYLFQHWGNKKWRILA